jgi:hypothetical protein
MAEAYNTFGERHKLTEKLQPKNLKAQGRVLTHTRVRDIKTDFKIK